jgi:hypothetical protein
VTISELTLNNSAQSSNVQPASVINDANVNLAAELQSLKDKLDDNVASNIDTIAAKDTIIQLRIQLGEGTSAENFQDEFPYLPK